MLDAKIILNRIKCWVFWKEEKYAKTTLSWENFKFYGYVLDIKGVEKEPGKNHSDETVSPAINNKHARRLGHISYEWWDPYLRPEYSNISVWYQDAEI